MKFHRTVLNNGVRLITVPMKDAATATVFVLVEAGSNYEKQSLGGISHFLEHMCFKGTTRRPSAHVLSTELDSIGAEYNAFTSNEYTGYYAKAHAKHLAKIIDVVSDLYQNQRFDEVEIEREKGVIIEEINMYEDMPNHKVQEVFVETMYPGQPAGRSIAGTKETVSSITREDFIKYVKDHYVAEATTVVVAGLCDPEEVEILVGNAFEKLSTGKAETKSPIIDAQKETLVGHKKKDSDQTHIVLGMRAYDVLDEKNYTLKVLGGVLGRGMSSRLFQLLREKMGVCYYVRAEVDSSTDHGVFQISAGVDTTRIEEVITALVGELKKLINEPVPAEELTKVKEYITGKMFLSLESSDSFAEYVGFQEIFHKPIQTPEEVAVKIQSITPAQIQSIAQELFRSDNFTLALVSPYDKVDTLKKLLKI